MWSHVGGQNTTEQETRPMYLLEIKGLLPSSAEVAPISNSLTVLSAANAAQAKFADELTMAMI